MAPEAQRLLLGDSQSTERQEVFLNKRAFKWDFEGWLNAVPGMGTAWAKVQRWQKRSM